MPEKSLLDYYIQHSDKRFDQLEKKVDTLLSFKWLLVGAASAVSFVISIAFKIFEAVAGGR